jgi:hypothetical protein
MVNQMQHLTKIAEENRGLKKERGWRFDDGGAAAIPYLVAIAKSGLPPL